MSETIEINYKEIFLKNNYVLGFSIAALITFIVGLIGFFKFSLGINIINQAVSLYSPIIWMSLCFSFVISSFLAYKGKIKWMVLPVLIWLIFTTAAVRTSNLPQLKDVTTNDWTLGPDLDPFLYLRLAEDINEGNLGKIDSFRYAPIGTPNYAYDSMMPWAIVLVSKITPLFGEDSLTYAAIISPVIFFIISLIGFFLFCYVIFSFNFSKGKSLVAALIASFFYASIPQMLHRTTGGIPEIESLGMVWFWFAFLFYSLAWKKEKQKEMIFYGILAGIFTGLMTFSWGGFRYIYLSFFLSGLVFFLFHKDQKKNFIIYSSWLIPSLIFLAISRSFNPNAILFSLTDSAPALFLFGILLFNYLYRKIDLNNKLRINKINIPDSIKVIVLFILTLAILSLIISPSKIIEITKKVFENLLYPFGRGRVGFTIAENKAPYFVEVFSNFGYLFWAFFFGLIFLFYDTVKNFRIKERLKLNLFFIIFIISFIFSRISPSSSLNGENFFSKILYFGGLLLFGIITFWIFVKAYREKDQEILHKFENIDFSYILLLSLAFLAIVSMRGAIRLFFIISPILILISIYLPVKLFDLSKIKSLRSIFIPLFVISILVLGIVFVQYQGSTTAMAKSEVPSPYTNQWQKAMGWVRENTPEGSIFTHWWDYGYWVQTLGERPTVSDGGHYIGYWDHLVGRYLLTTQNPDTAYSFMKSHNVSYLLIDSTDLGKYPAYSSIGSDASGQDRYASIAVMGLDTSQTYETANGTTFVYSGGIYLDEDINYNFEGKDVLLPANKAAVAGVIWNSIKSGSEGVKFERPIGVFFYNNKRYDIPLRYVYLNNELIDFKSGLDAVVRVIPSFDGSNINPTGSIIYLSPKVQKGLFAQLYLLNNSFGNYDEIKLVHSEDDLLISAMKESGFNIGDFVYYAGLRAPIKIFKVDYPENIIAREEFLRTEGDYAEFDNLVFTK